LGIINGRLCAREDGLPLYEYQCSKCGKRIEKIQKFSDRPLSKCEYCGGTLERLLSSPAIQFKGSGWYVTDYARKSASSESSQGEGSSGGNGKKPAAPAKKAEPSATPSSKN
jgi:putative FmdB family regulatory protein